MLSKTKPSTKSATKQHQNRANQLKKPQIVINEDSDELFRTSLNYTADNIREHTKPKTKTRKTTPDKTHRKKSLKSVMTRSSKSSKEPKNPVDRMLLNLNLIDESYNESPPSLSNQISISLGKHSQQKVAKCHPFKTVDHSSLSVAESCTIRRNRERYPKEWQTILAQANVRLIKLMLSKKRKERPFANRRRLERMSMKEATPRRSSKQSRRAGRGLDSASKSKIKIEWIGVKKDEKGAKKDKNDDSKDGGSRRGSSLPKLSQEKGQKKDPNRRSNSFWDAPQSSILRNLEEGKKKYDAKQKQRCVDILSNIKKRAMLRLEANQKLRKKRLNARLRRREVAPSVKFSEFPKLLSSARNAKSLDHQARVRAAKEAVTERTLRAQSTRHKSKFISKMEAFLKNHNPGELKLDWRLRDRLLTYDEGVKGVHDLDEWESVNQDMFGAQGRKKRRLRRRRFNVMF